MRILDASYNCGIDNNGISRLTNLISLSVSGNNKITNINHLVNLQILDANYNNCGIDNRGVSQLTNLVKINADYNKKLTRTQNMVKIKIAYGTIFIRCDNTSWCQIV